MKINFKESESGSDLDGIDFSFLSLFTNLTVEKQHKILLAYLEAVQTITHTDHNPNISVSEKEKVANLFNKINELKDFDKFTKQIRLFKSDKSKFKSLINEISRERKHFAEEWKRTLTKVAILQKENNKLVLEIQELKQNQIRRKPR